MSKKKRSAKLKCKREESIEDFTSDMQDDDDESEEEKRPPPPRRSSKPNPSINV